MSIPNTNKPFSIFPDLPRNEPVVNPDGSMNMYWLMFFDALVLALQKNFNQEGIVVPQQSDANITLLTSKESLANILYDSTINQFVGNILNTLVNPPNGTQFWLPFAMITTYAGNPNSNVAGYLTELCLDTSTPALYICTTAGDAAGATWTAT